MISSIDGRLLTGRWNAPDGGSARDLVFHVYDEAADRLGRRGWIVGRRTMSNYVKGERTANPGERQSLRPPYIARPTADGLAIVFDPSGKLIYDSDNVDGDHVVAVLSERVEDDYLIDLRRVGVSYLFGGPEGHDVDTALKALNRHFGVEMLLLEGGGTLNGAFYAAGLIDEFSTLVFPMVDGMNGIPSIVNYTGSETITPAGSQRFRLISCEALTGGVVWLRHAVVNSAADTRSDREDE